MLNKHLRENKKTLLCVFIASLRLSGATAVQPPVNFAVTTVTIRISALLLQLELQLNSDIKHISAEVESKQTVKKRQKFSK